MRVNNLSLEDMLLIIAENNDITGFNLVLYEAVEFDYNRPDCLEDPELGLIETIPIPASSIKKELDRLKRKDYLVGISSDIRLRDGTHLIHMFLLDFCCPVCEENLEKVITLVQDCNLIPGFIVDSGKSYHFYFNGVVDPKTWQNLFDRVSRSEIIDKNWIALQLWRDYSVLRLTTNKAKPQQPKVVEAVGYVPVNPSQLYLFDIKPERTIERDKFM